MSQSYSHPKVERFLRHGVVYQSLIVRRMRVIPSSLTTHFRSQTFIFGTVYLASSLPGLRDRLKTCFLPMSFPWL